MRISDWSSDVCSSDLTGRSFMTWQSIQSAVTDHVPAENWEGAYNIVPVPAAELRRKLLAMTSSGGKDDRAARCLNLIDKLRDECENGRASCRERVGQYV